MARNAQRWPSRHDLRTQDAARQIVRAELRQTVTSILAIITWLLACVIR
jgi:hypothetical protein